MGELAREDYSAAFARGERGELSEGGSPSTEPSRLALHHLRTHQLEVETLRAEACFAQQQLASLRVSYADLYDFAPVGYLTVNEAGSILEANRTVSAYLAIPKGTLVGQSLLRFIAEDDVDTYRRHAPGGADLCTRKMCELRLVRSGGETFWARIEANVLDEAIEHPGSGRTFLLAVSDIADRKRAEESLRESEARADVVFETARDAKLVLSGRNLPIVAANRAALALFGATSARELTKPLFAESVGDAHDAVTRLGLDDSEIVRKTSVSRHIADALEMGHASFSWAHTKLSGERFPSTVTLTRLEMGGDRALEVTIHDDTNESRLRTMLAQSDRLASVGMLAAGVAHKINNPLCYVLSNVDVLTHELPKIGAAVKVCCDALRRGVGDEAYANLVGEGAALLAPESFADVARYAAEALDGTERIRSIARALGSFSRVETEAHGPVDLKRCIESAVRMSFNEIKYRAKLITSFGDVPTLWGSEGKLGQLFLNLLVNASHAITEGEIDDNQIVVRTWTEGAEVFVEIADTGKGIDGADLARVFDPFFTTKPVGVGTGLGLAICRNVVAELGGELQVWSELGKGSRFTVRLPIRAAPPPIVHDLAAKARSSSFPPPSIAPAHGRILVVDDEQVIQNTIARALGTDHDVITVSSGELARDLLETDTRFDAIVSDLMMPGMTGMDLHAWLLKSAPKLAKKMVFVTGGAFTPQGSAFLARIRNQRLEKPFSDDALRTVVMTLVRPAKG